MNSSSELIDVVVVASAFVYAIFRAVLRAVQRPRRPGSAFRHTRLLVDGLNGVGFVSFGLMVLAAFSEDVARVLIGGDRVLVALTGMLGLSLLVGEVLREQD